MQWTTIAQCLGVSPKTLYRKRLEYGFEDSFTDISDEELECNIRDVLRLTPFSGESYIWGASRGCGIFIQRWKIWQVLQAIDPVNCAIRSRSPIRHHLYSVKKPNHLANNLANTVLQTQYCIALLMVLKNLGSPSVFEVTEESKMLMWLVL